MRFTSQMDFHHSCSLAKKQDFGKLSLPAQLS